MDGIGYLRVFGGIEHLTVLINVSEVPRWLLIFFGQLESFLFYVNEDNTNPNFNFRFSLNLLHYLSQEARLCIDSTYQVELWYQDCHILHKRIFDKQGI